MAAGNESRAAFFACRLAMGQLQSVRRYLLDFLSFFVGHNEMQQLAVNFGGSRAMRIVNVSLNPFFLFVSHC